MLFYGWVSFRAGGGAISAELLLNLHRAVLISLVDVKHSFATFAALFGTLWLGVRTIATAKRNSNVGGKLKRLEPQRRLLRRPLKKPPS
jgi:hypothetical protein